VPAVSLPELYRQKFLAPVYYYLKVVRYYAAANTQRALVNSVNSVNRACRRVQDCGIDRARRTAGIDLRGRSRLLPNEGARCRAGRVYPEGREHTLHLITDRRTTRTWSEVTGAKA